MSLEANRCDWRGMAGDRLYEAYHDTEWGVPEYDSRALWEKLVLDGFQAGLAWITILRKREAFRAAFADFDPAAVARFGEVDREARGRGAAPRQERGPPPGTWRSPARDESGFRRRDRDRRPPDGGVPGSGP